MQSDKSRTVILNKMNSAIKQEPLSILHDEEAPAPDEMQKQLIATFIEKLTTINGEVLRCEDVADLAYRLKQCIGQKINDNKLVVHCIDKHIQQFLDEYAIAYDNSNDTFDEMDIGISRSEFLIARTGSVVFSSAQNTGRRINIYPQVHIVIASENQVVAELDETLSMMNDKYSGKPSTISIISGPSRMADLKKTLIIGAHGPKEFIVFLVKNDFFE